MKLNDLLIRESKGSDLPDVLQVERLAFQSEEEAVLVKDLLEDPSAKPALSLLAFDGNKAVGHILFTRCEISGLDQPPLAHILAPLAVIPEYQSKGVGGKLIISGLDHLKSIGSEIVFVLGYWEYYSRYGFIPDAGSLGFEATYPIPEKVANAWMVKYLTYNQKKSGKGKVICADAMNKPEYWEE